MGSIGGIEAGKSNEGKKNKDVAQGAIEEGSRFWKKLKIFLGCMILSSKEKANSSDKSTQGEEGRNVRKDIVRRKRSKRSSSTNEDEELIANSSNLRRFTFHDIRMQQAISIPGLFLVGEVLELCSKVEIKYLGELYHPNLVRLVGYCMEEDKRVLIYEYMCRGSLEKYPFQRTMRLPWRIELKIAMDAANGPTFRTRKLHWQVIFRDFKTSNILLDKILGLQKMLQMGDKNHVSTRGHGNRRLYSPEYVMTRHLTSKSDVYSFGMVLLEMVTGRRVCGSKEACKREKLGKMGSIAGIRVSSTIGDKSNEGKNNKDVVQGEEGSRFLKKLRIFLCCMFWSSKEEASSRNKINQANGENATNDVDEQQPIAPTSSSNTRLSSYETWCVTDQELFEASLLLRRFTFHDLMLATRTFKVENFHDEEGFGILLKGWINSYGNYAARPGTGIPIAVKSLNFNEFQHPKEWLGFALRMTKGYLYMSICVKEV
ncbi:hypothetical protein ACSQ67_008294 [Phaseolus vulgaris]